MSFEAWMKKVDAILLAKCGMDHRDLADVPYRQWFDDKVSPKSAASRAFKAQE
jgi:hypothetical protein